MAIPSSVGTNQFTLAKAWERYMLVWGSVKTSAQALVARSTAGPVLASDVAQYSSTLAGFKDELTTLAAVPGIEAYGRAQINNPSLDLAAEHTASLAQLTATVNWVINNFPKDGSGYLQLLQLDANGKKVDRSFSSAELSTFRTVLNALVATIN